MACLQFIENTKPDKPGIWLFRRGDGVCEAVYVTADRMSTQLRGTWAFVCEIPVVKEPPKYRDVRRGDEGKMIQVDRGAWQTWYFIGFRSYGDITFEVPGGIGYAKPEQCRILDDERPRPQPRRFWFANQGGCNCWSRHDHEPTHLAERVLVQEVGDE